MLSELYFASIRSAEGTKSKSCYQPTLNVRMLWHAAAKRVVPSQNITYGFYNSNSAVSEAFKLASSTSVTISANGFPQKCLRHSKIRWPSGFSSNIEYFSQTNADLAKRWFDISWWHGYLTSSAMMPATEVVLISTGKNLFYWRWIRTHASLPITRHWCRRQMITWRAWQETYAYFIRHHIEYCFVDFLPHFKKLTRISLLAWDALYFEEPFILTLPQHKAIFRSIIS